jgi:hypothetical protein
LGYLSSRADEKLLVDSVWQTRMAQALKRAIDEHFEANAAMTMGSTDAAASPLPQ